MSDKVYVAGSNLGKGGFAKEDIKKGKEILRFTGPLIDFKQAVNKDEKQGDPLQIGKNLYISIEEPGRSINHSCSPNAGIRDDVVLVALEDIQKGEEIYYDYSTTMDEDYWVMQCKCRSANCRKIIEDFKHLPSEVQQKYFSLKVVQQFIAIQH